MPGSEAVCWGGIGGRIRRGRAWAVGRVVDRETDQASGQDRSAGFNSFSLLWLPWIISPAHFGQALSLHFPVKYLDPSPTLLW